MKKIKALTLLLLCVFCIMFLSSCEKPGTELSELMIMQGIGIDFENGEYVVDKVRSGDEARHGIWAQADCGVILFILGE